MTWTDNLSAQSGDFSVIASLLTQANGIVLDDIYTTLESWAGLQSGLETINDLIDSGMAVNCAAGDVPGLSIDSVATLHGLALIRSSDNIHVQPTALGWQFIQVMREQ